jgi:hypothetical protein
MSYHVAFTGSFWQEHLALAAIVHTKSYALLSLH